MKALRTWLPAIFWLAIFTAAAIAFQLGVDGKPSQVLLDSDAGNITSFAMAKYSPELFQGDALLDHPEYFGFYRTVHFPLLHLWSHFAGDYASYFVLTVGLHLWVQMVGFFVLGVTLFGNVPLAGALGLASIAPFGLPLGEFWGAWPNAIPRVAFQSLLPYLLALAMHTRNQPKAWPFLSLLFGSMVYIHPVSAPAWGLAYWIGLFLSHPPEWSCPQRLKQAFLCALVGLLPVLPFTLNYFTHQVLSPAIPYQTLFDSVNLTFEKGFLKLPFFLMDFHFKYERLTWAWAALGAAWVYFLYPLTRPRLKLWLLWFITILFVSAFLPSLEQILCRRLQRMPYEYDLIRGLRYCIPLLLVLCLWPAIALKTNHISTLIAVCIFSATWIGLHPIHGMVLPWGSTRMNTPTMTEASHSARLLEALDSLRVWPKGTRVLANLKTSGEELAIRYHAHKPLVFSSKDGGTLAYSNTAAFMDWFRLKNELKAADATFGLRGWLMMGKKLGAQILMVDRELLRTSDTLIRPSAMVQGFAFYQLNDF